MSELDQFRRTLAAVRASGQDEIEQLDRQGVLLTRARLMQLRVESMEQVIDLIDAIPAHSILNMAGQPGNLAEDYRKALIGHLSDLAAQARNKWFK